MLPPIRPPAVAAQMVLRLNDGQLQTLMAMARPIPRFMRSDWLISVAASLNILRTLAK
jgi:hypothetical protein